MVHYISSPPAPLNEMAILEITMRYLGVLESQQDQI